MFNNRNVPSWFYNLESTSRRSDTRGSHYDEDDLQTLVELGEDCEGIDRSPSVYSFKSKMAVSRKSSSSILPEIRSNKLKTNDRASHALRSLPLESELEQYLKFLSSSKSKQQKFTNNLHRRAVSRGPLDRPLLPRPSVFQQQKKRFGDELLKEKTTNETLTNQQRRTYTMKDSLKRMLNS
ncbi:unnamed protein product [Dimorphilus gyrociliatus]|uniref:Uncharacterized protein n=1 Tax=Dimorphilus gyrociliatus TaxID=2664684 RepID=A0A7I8VPR3_9ANNE|nr:unnamed protein product [Dimorphilus gyrociliatus]